MNTSDQQPYHVVTLGFVSLYFKELQPAITFYSQVFGEPDSVDETSQIYGWRMGTTWLTLLPSRASTTQRATRVTQSSPYRWRRRGSGCTLSGVDCRRGKAMYVACRHQNVRTDALCLCR